MGYRKQLILSAIAIGLVVIAILPGQEEQADDTQEKTASVSIPLDLPAEPLSKDAPVNTPDPDAVTLAEIEPVEVTTVEVAPVEEEIIEETVRVEAPVATDNKYNLREPATSTASTPAAPAPTAPTTKPSNPSVSTNTTTPQTNAAGSVGNLQPNDYTIQLLTLSTEQKMKDFIAQHQLQGKVNYVKRDNNYVLLYGQYRTKEQAKQAIETLSPALKAAGPWVRQAKDF